MCVQVGGPVRPTSHPRPVQSVRLETPLQILIHNLLEKCVRKSFAPKKEEETPFVLSCLKTAGKGGGNLLGRGGLKAKAVRGRVGGVVLSLRRKERGLEQDAPGRRRVPRRGRGKARE